MKMPLEAWINHDTETVLNTHVTVVAFADEGRTAICANHDHLTIERHKIEKLKLLSEREYRDYKANKELSEPQDSL